MRKRRMAATTIDPSLSLEMHKNVNQHGAVMEEIQGLVRVYKDGHVERLPIVPCVTTTSHSLAPDLGVTSRDIIINKFTNIWARFYVPKSQTTTKLPLLVYFHGGGFCVGSAAWICYHEFLAMLANKTGCIIMSVNYRLAPENPLPAAYEDGFNALMWLRQQAISGEALNIDSLLSRQCNFFSIFLAGDSAGANIAHNVALRLGNNNNNYETLLKPLTIKGTILIQPFFGGEKRTDSEKYLAKAPRSVLSLAASDTYWRLALPCGSSRDHRWCNPTAKGSREMEECLVLGTTMVCIAEMDILKDRNLEYCEALSRTGKRVEQVMYKGVGHAFQILNSKADQLSLTRTHEMVVHIKAFITRSS